MLLKKVLIPLFFLFLCNWCVNGSSKNKDRDLNRIQIRVYREPTINIGETSYAPWGYWTQQPADAR